MGRLIKYLLYLVVIGAICLAAYALVFELPAPQSEVIKQIETKFN